MLPFKIRKRLSRCNRVLIDRYLPDTDEESNFSQYYEEHHKIHYSKEFVCFEVYFALENDILKEKMNKFSKICVFSDSEEETNETLKNLKKNVLNNFKIFLKQNRGLPNSIKP